MAETRRDNLIFIQVNVTLRAFDPPLRYPLNESDLKDKFRVIGEEDDPAEALEDLKRKKKAEHCVEIKFRAPQALRLRDGVEIYAIDIDFHTV